MTSGIGITRGWVVCAIVAGFAACAVADPSPPPAWDHAEQLAADAGYVQLRWIAPNQNDEVDWFYQLEEATRADFGDARLRMDGHGTASFLSGLEDGSYYYRLRARAVAEQPWSAWSSPVQVSVQHHSRAMALGLLAVGAIVFLATAAFLIAHRNDAVDSSRA